MTRDVAQLGQVFTPPNVVAFMLGLCQNAGRVLEPSTGDGAFFATLRQRGADVVGIEIDRGVAPEGAQVGDFFAYPLSEQFDTIVGNPPYVRYQDVAVDTKKRPVFTGRFSLQVRNQARRQVVPCGLSSKAIPAALSSSRRRSASAKFFAFLAAARSAIMRSMAASSSPLAAAAPPRR